MMHAWKQLTILAALASGLVSQLPSQDRGEMTPATVYKALAERMLMAADETEDPVRSAELLQKAEAAMESFETAREREDLHRQPRAMGERIQHLASALQRMAASIVNGSSSIREGFSSLPGDALAREEFALEVGVMLERAHQTLALVEEGAQNLRSERRLLLEFFVEHPEVQESRTVASSLEYLNQALDCITVISYEIERIALVKNKLGGGVPVPGDR